MSFMGGNVPRNKITSNEGSASKKPVTNNMIHQNSIELEQSHIGQNSFKQQLPNKRLSALPTYQASNQMVIYPTFKSYTPDNNHNSDETLFKKQNNINTLNLYIEVLANGVYIIIF